MQTFVLRRLVLASVLSMFAAGVWAQAATAKKEKGFEPTVGQEGKDVVWVPTSQALVNRMLDMAKVTPNDYVVDLGSGDGRTVITAAKRGARAMGVEYNPDMVALSKRRFPAAADHRPHQRRPWFCGSSGRARARRNERSEFHSEQYRKLGRGKRE